MADDQKVAVYVSWVTFKNSIESLAQGIPNQIDRSTFPGFSGGVQNQLFSAMKFLGLVNEDDTPTPALHALAVADESKRKEKLKQIIQERYSDLFSLDLQKATPQQLADKMGESYGVTGDTREKAMRFFLSAVAYVGIPVSRFFKVPGTTGSGNGIAPRKRRTSTRKPADQDQDDDDDQVNEKPTGTSRAVELESGGTLTLTASIDLFQLTPSDRTFVFGLIDALEKYKKEVADKATK